MLQNQTVLTELHVKESSNVCLNTQQICLETARHCVEMGGKYAEREHVRLFLDTAALCHTALDTAGRASWLQAHATSACAAMCARTAAVCDTFPHDECMVRCARLCRECVKYCIEANDMPVA